MDYTRVFIVDGKAGYSFFGFVQVDGQGNLAIEPEYYESMDIIYAETKKFSNEWYWEKSPERFNHVGVIKEVEDQCKRTSMSNMVEFSEKAIEYYS